MDDLHAGDLLLYDGYETTPSVKIERVMLPGRPEYDGAVPGISFKWLKGTQRHGWFYPCSSVNEFLNDYRFRNLRRIARMQAERRE